MSSQAEKAARFLELHRPGDPLLLPNPWDAGSAKLLESLGFLALATTSGGFAATLGRLDGNVTRAEAIAHATIVVASVGVPVSADLENCFADHPEEVGETARMAVAAGLAGFSVEDWSGSQLYASELATDRVAAAVEAAHAGGDHVVVTARCENYLRGRPDLAETISRLQSFQDAGADVLYAPGLTDLADIRSLVSSVDRPVNVLAWAGAPAVGDLASVGVARVSVGSAFANVGLGAVVQAAEELRARGTYGFSALAAEGSKAARSAFGG